MSAPNSPLFLTPDSVVPADFPRAGVGAVPGFQSKVLAVKSGDTYAQGMSESEAHARYQICFDLVNQLQAYCHRKLLEHPDWTPRILLSKLRIGVVRRYDWGCSPAELQWMLTQLCIRMNWAELADENVTIEFKSICPEVTISDQKLIDKLLGHKYGPDGSRLPPERSPETIVDQVRRRLGSGPTTELEQ